jgi:hypothetical protein
MVVEASHSDQMVVEASHSHLMLLIPRFDLWILFSPPPKLMLLILCILFSPPELLS